MSATEQQFTPLDFDPFEGDFGSPGDRTLSDAMVKARKGHTCWHCKGPIQPGDIYRKRCDIVDGQMEHAKWCALCCEAMVEELKIAHGDIDDDELDERYPFEDRHDAALTTGAAR